MWDEVRHRITVTVRKHPDTNTAGWTTVRLKACVEEGVVRARLLGLMTEEAIEAFVVSMFSISPHFHRVPQARDALAETAFAELERVRRAREAATSDPDALRRFGPASPPWAEHAREGLGGEKRYWSRSSEGSEERNGST